MNAQENGEGRGDRSGIGHALKVDFIILVQRRGDLTPGTIPPIFSPLIILVLALGHTAYE